MPIARCLLAFAAARGAQDLPKGQLVEKVTCSGEAGQSYALYLPSSYAADREWPILYCFDPAARGRVPVERFREAAERYGYIVAGSNNSRNGPFEVSLAAMNAVWRDTHTRFAIDSRRVYAAGFSGGARVACAMGLAGGLLAGVIAASGGFPAGDLPSAIPFAFFGTAGTDDFSRSELKQLDGDLDRLGVPHRVVVFEGGHDWPASALAAEALEWLEIQAMRAGQRAKDDALLEAVFRKRLAEAEGLEAAGKLPEAWSGYAALAADFRGLLEVAALEKKAAELQGSKSVKAFLRREEEQERRRQDLEGELSRDYEALGEPLQQAASLAALRIYIARLRKNADAKADSSERRLARRVLGGLYIRAYEEAQHLLAQKSYLTAAVKLELAVAIRPDRPQVLYGLARAWAQAGEKKKALEALKRAVAAGFNDAARLEEDAAFQPLRGEAGFQKLLGAIKGG